MSAIHSEARAGALPRRARVLQSEHGSEDADTADQEELVAVSKVNALLARIRVPITVSSIHDCVPSLWVAILESLLEARIPGVVRAHDIISTNIDSSSDRNGNGNNGAPLITRLQNAQAVVWALEQQILQMELPHIRAENIVEAERRTVFNLVDIIWEIARAVDGASIQMSNDSQTAAAGGVGSLIGDNAPLGSLPDISSIDSQDAISLLSDRNHDDYDEASSVDVESLADLQPSRPGIKSQVEHQQQRMRHAAQTRPLQSLHVFPSSSTHAAEVASALLTATAASLPTQRGPRRAGTVSTVAGQTRHSPRSSRSSKSGSASDTRSSKRDHQEIYSDAEEYEAVQERRLEQAEKQERERRKGQRRAQEQTLRQQPVAPVDDTEEAQPATPVQGSRRRIRFSSNIAQYSTPPVLRILPEDTPHTRALKIRRAALLRQEHTRSARLAAVSASPAQSPWKVAPGGASLGLSETQKKLNRMRQQHKQLLGVSREPLPGEHVRIGSRSSAKRQRLDSRGRSGSEGNDYENDGTASNQEAAFEARADARLAAKNEPLSQAERNLHAFEDRVRQTVPLLEAFPRIADSERTWRSQLSTWTRALDDRVWTQKVVMQKELDGIQDEAPLDYLRKDALRTQLLNLRSSHAQATHKAKANVNEQVRRIKRIEHRQRVIEQDVKSVLERRRLKEEQLVSGLMDDYMKAQRQAVLEERRLERDMRKKEDEKRKIQETSRRTFLEDQIRMLNDQLAQVKKEERIVQQAQSQEVRQLVREQKEYAKTRISTVKSKLSQDWDDMHMPAESVSSLRGSIGFAVRPTAGAQSRRVQPRRVG
ncbi:hypothetical protein BC831DRAFT_465593 [Entophlyctis helioformis]|nr:hypothetical protein BC831DRAFT_465593 [Entophlyctis helioformis]